MTVVFRRALHYENISYVDIHRSYREVLTVLSEPYYRDQHEYRSSVGLFVQKGAGIKPEYERAATEFYRSSVLDVDFGASGSGEVLRAMNK